MHLSRIDRLPYERELAATRNRNIGTPGQRQEGQGILCGQFNIHVATHGSNRLQLYFRRGQGQEEGQSIIDAGISVYDDTLQELPPKKSMQT
jgi:hypothetical protein